MKHWYAVHCKPRQDARAEAHLLNQGFEVLRPLIRTRARAFGQCRDVIDSMFPRYLFICLDDLAQDWAPIRSTRGVTGLVRWGGCVPRIPEVIINGLRERMDGEGCVDLDCDDFKPNQKLRITDGPFAGHEGLFQARCSEQRVIVLLNIMQRAHRLALPEKAVANA